MIKTFLLVFVFLFADIALSKEYIGSDGPTFETTKELTDTVFATGLEVPKGWEERDSFKADLIDVYDGELPAKFDWRDKGLTPIRNQGSCGSCWAFSMTAMLADVVKLHGLGSHDLSEQFLVSCDNNSNACRGGWINCHMFEKYGSVLESLYPYTGRSSRCDKSGLSYVYKIKSWTRVANGIPDTEVLKRVIYTYGPVSVAVSASGSFRSYSSGIMNVKGGRVNHATNIVGWDDTVKPAHWIMRNSWGSNWGEDGYMKIAYKAKQIGYAAAYIDFNGPIPQKPKPEPEPPIPPKPPEPEPCEDECKPCTFWRWLAYLFDV